MNNVRLGISGTLACLTAIIQVLLVQQDQCLWQKSDVQFHLNVTYSCVDRPRLHAVRVRCHLSVRILRQRLHDCCRPADPHLGAQVHLRHQCAALQRSAGCYICKSLFRIKIEEHRNTLMVWSANKIVLFLSQTLVDIIRGLPDTNVASLVFALVSSLVLIVVKELGARYRHKLPFPVPMEIIIVSNSAQKFTLCLDFGGWKWWLVPVPVLSAGGGGHGHLRPSAPSWDLSHGHSGRNSFGVKEKHQNYLCILFSPHRSCPQWVSGRTCWAPLSPWRSLDMSSTWLWAGRWPPSTATTWIQTR